MPIPMFQETLDGAVEKYQRGEPEWTPSSAEVADYFLNVLPPIYGPGKFACSEPYTHNNKGEGVYLAFRNVNDVANTAEARYLTRAEINAP